MLVTRLEHGTFQDQPHSFAIEPETFEAWSIFVLK